MTSRCERVRGPEGARLLVENLGPRKLAHEHDLLVDLVLRGLVAEHAAQIVDFRGDQLVVLRKEALRGALEVAFRHGDLLRGAQGDLFVHHGSASYGEGGW